VDTRDVPRARARDGKTVVLPRVAAPRRSACGCTRAGPRADLVPASGTSRARPGALPEVTLATWTSRWFPALAADRAAIASGYGAGYFDKLLAAAAAAALRHGAPAAFVVRSLPHEAHDVARRPGTSAPNDRTHHRRQGHRAASSARSCRARRSA
jgi:5-formyltetrahydrofolate cyclo-ligase